MDSLLKHAEDHRRLAAEAYKASAECKKKEEEEAKRKAEEEHARKTRLRTPAELIAICKNKLIIKKE